MQISVLAAFILILSLLENGEVLWPARPWPTLAALVVYWSGTAALAGLVTWHTRREMTQRGYLSSSALRRRGLGASLGHAWQVLGAGAAAIAGYGDWILSDLHLRGIPLIGTLAVLAPFVGALLIGWLLDYPYHVLTRQQVARQRAAIGQEVTGPWRLGEYLAYNFRHQFLFIAAPLSILVLIKDVLELLQDHYHWPAAVPAAGVMAAVVAVAIGSPAMIVRIWRTRPLGPGPLRSDLEALCRKLKIRARDILVWQSGGVIANAAVIGIVPSLRYVLLSDSLLENMESRQVQAVFAHEAGHIAFHHLLYMLVFAFSAGTLCAMAAGAAATLLHLDDLGGEMITLGLLAGAWLWVFGWVSRRLERQSDVFSAWAMGPNPEAGEDNGRITAEGAAAFAWALQQIAQLNGLAAGQWNWRHGSVADRVSYVLWLGGTGGTRQAADRVVRRIKIVLWIALACAGALAAVFAG